MTVVKLNLREIVIKLNWAVGLRWSIFFPNLTQQLCHTKGNTLQIAKIRKSQAARMPTGFDNNIFPLNISYPFLLDGSTVVRLEAKKRRRKSMPLCWSKIWHLRDKPVPAICASWYLVGTTAGVRLAALGLEIWQHPTIWLGPRRQVNLPHVCGQAARFATST